MDSVVHRLSLTTWSFIRRCNLSFVQISSTLTLFRLAGIGSALPEGLQSPIVLVTGIGGIFVAGFTQIWCYFEFGVRGRGLRMGLSNVPTNF